jgi:hypothetical protein
MDPLEKIHTTKDSLSIPSPSWRCIEVERNPVIVWLVHHNQGCAHSGLWFFPALAVASSVRDR